jgi:hypothetical protein
MWPVGHIGNIVQVQIILDFERIYCYKEYMKATLIVHQKFELKSLNPEIGDVAVKIQVWKIPPPNDQSYPEGKRYSLVGYQSKNPKDKVLLDCHPPKGPHFHTDSGDLLLPEMNYEDAFEMFWRKLEEKFGPFPEVEE